MKKLLTILTSAGLLVPTVNSIISCNSHPKHVPDDDAGEGTNDVEIINKIMKKVKETFKAWWDKKATIDINTYPDQITKFQELVDNVKKHDNLTLVGKKISQWRFLDQLVTGFKTEFENINREIANEYSNFYLHTMPLSIEPNDIMFTLSHINFDNLAKLLTVNNNSIMGITINFKVSYQIKFKNLEQRDSIDGLVVICNDIEALNGIQEDLENYFIAFIDELFKKKNYNAVAKSNISFDRIYVSNTVWPHIEQELRAIGIVFKGRIGMWRVDYSYDYDREFQLYNRMLKSNSVLPWAGEGYNAEKLTPENFLEFYKQNYFSPRTIQDYYVKGIMAYFRPDTLTIENLPFKSTRIDLKNKIYLIKEKAKIDEDLNQFAKTTMQLWQYYQIETYNDKLVFKVNQDDFDNLIKTAVSLNNTVSFNLKQVFIKVFSIFVSTLNSTVNLNSIIRIVDGKINLIKETKSFAFQLFWKQSKSGYYSEDNAINFEWSNFAYSFFFGPSYKETNTDKTDEFLQTIEFKVV
ncbi:lipoprotein [Spiroplasma sp. SV19]|uniref:lipoprotein n=1 Tax=Spiroplasma sp. SV19 TaxID=2570468 RepID=UPI0024B7A483|nr:lipoprotein [Spiroplasma sp. SV19]WHQ36578.1 hypothetical protein E7Y35_01375 [Spiroplasma sp. SV19]